MKNEKYIKTIEELNKEYLDYTHSKAYLKNNRKQKTKKYIKNFAYKRLFNAFKTSLYNRFNKPRNIPMNMKKMELLKLLKLKILLTKLVI